MSVPEGKPTKNKGMPIWKKVVLWIVALCSIAFLSYVGYIVYYFSYRGDATEIVAVANQFEPDPSWKLVSEDITVPQNFCGDLTCPRVYRSWKLKNSYTPDGLKQLARQAGWDFPINGTCETNPQTVGPALVLCSADGIANGYRISIAISGSSSLSNKYISISVQEETKI